jgi:hypothetical protein
MKITENVKFCKENFGFEMRYQPFGYMIRHIVAFGIAIALLLGGRTFPLSPDA